MASRADAAPPLPATRADAPTSWRRLCGVAVGVLVRAWLATLRVEVVESPELERARSQPWVLCFWHGATMLLLAWPRRGPTAALVSLSADGELLAGALGFLGLAVERGSSSRGGARGLARIVRRARERGHDVAFAVDGPRGPRGRSKGGAAFAAERARAALVPMGAAARRATELSSWDGFRVPWPFSRVVITLGAPLEASGAHEAALDRAIGEADARARSLAGAAP